MAERMPVKERIQRELERQQRIAVNAEKNIAYYSRLLSMYDREPPHYNGDGEVVEPGDICPDCEEMRNV